MTPIQPRLQPRVNASSYSSPDFRRSGPANCLGERETAFVETTPVRFRFGLAESPFGSVWVGANGSRVSRPEEYRDIMTSENVMFLLPTPCAPKLRFVASSGTFVFIEPLKPRGKRTHRGVVAELKVLHSTRSPEKLPVDRLAFVAHAHHSTLAGPEPCRRSEQNTALSESCEGHPSAYSPTRRTAGRAHLPQQRSGRSLP